jgi:hypothetical protein
MAQDPEHDQDAGEEGLNPTHELDMVTLYRSTTVQAEIESDMIRGLMESNGIPALIVRAMGLPSFGFEVQVPRQHEAEAKRLIAEAQAAGPEAAAEAERETES